MTAAPGRNPEAGDYTIECPGHGIGSRTKAHIASGLRVSRLGFERHQTRVATPNGCGRVCSDETVMAQTLPHRLQELESWMCKRLIHVGAMDERVRRVSNDCADAVRLWCCCDVSRCLGLVVLCDEIKMRQACHRPTQQCLRRTFAVSSGSCGYAMCDGISLGVTSSQIRFGFLSKQINRIKGAWRQGQTQDTQDTSKIDFIPEIANSTRCRKSSSTNCSKQGGEHDKPSFAAQFTGSYKEVTKNKRNEKEDDVAKTIKPSRRVVRKKEPAEVEAEQAAPACGASRNSNAGRILHLPSFLDPDLDFDLDISDFRLATRPHASLGLRRSSVRTSRTTRDDTCNAYDFFGHPEIGRRHCANRIRCQSGSVDAHKCYQCWANVITTTTTTALVQMT
ncbi:unnamed protein product, partial [Aureobasidium pullulans]